ncbi:hypothetical protein DENSPDRAFT_855373 [Dentipellis sp. KUC8613]|nr:hypothetical protein DENSPDRAFT_855373 [Dentipellis sp. KUC8613]
MYVPEVREHDPAAMFGRLQRIGRGGSEGYGTGGVREWRRGRGVGAAVEKARCLLREGLLRVLVSAVVLPAKYRTARALASRRKRQSRAGSATILMSVIREKYGVAVWRAVIVPQRLGFETNNGPEDLDGEAGDRRGDKLRDTNSNGRWAPPGPRSSTGQTSILSHNEDELRVGIPEAENSSPGSTLDYMLSERKHNKTPRAPSGQEVVIPCRLSVSIVSTVHTVGDRRPLSPSRFDHPDLEQIKRLLPVKPSAYAATISAYLSCNARGRAIRGVGCRTYSACRFMAVVSFGLAGVVMS